MHTSNHPADHGELEKEKMIMKKIIAIALSALMILGCLAGCGASGKDAGMTTVAPGKLTVAISPDFAPMEFVDATKTGQDQFVGFDVTLAKYLAQEMGLELEIVPMSFDACQTAVAMGQVDMAISGFSWMPERAEKYNLSDTYHAGDNESNQVLLTTAENKDLYANAESLTGLKVGAQTASIRLRHHDKTRISFCPSLTYIKGFVC